MYSIKNLFIHNKLERVFTPNSSAKLSYVNRTIIENDLKKYMSIPGKQIIIYGHSGGGKTTLIYNILGEIKCNFVKVHCESTTKFSDIILQAFDNLNAFYVKGKTQSVKYSVSNTLKVEYQSLSSSIKASISTENNELIERIVPPQLTSQKLAYFLGEVDSVLIIEDFHKVEENEKRKIADISKVFIDASTDYPNVKIICIGAVGTARELVELDNNLNSRIAEISVPLLSDEELEVIVNKGCSLLNIEMSNSLIEKIVYYSNNIGALAHQICFDICFAKNIKTNSFKKRLLNDYHLKYAIESFVKRNSGTFTKLYDSVIASSPYGWHILRVFNTLEKESLSINQIIYNISKNDNIQTEELIDFLNRLSTSEYSNLIRFDVNAQKYSISTPFFEAFLKMKFELDRQEKEKQKNKRKNKRKKRYNLNPSYEFTYSDQFLSKYIEILAEIDEARPENLLKLNKDKAN